MTGSGGKTGLKTKRGMWRDLEMQRPEWSRERRRDEHVLHKSLASENAHNHVIQTSHMTEFIEHPQETQLTSSHYLKIGNKPK